MRGRSPAVAAIGCLLLLSGCFVRGTRPLLISSADSDYSPVVTFAAHVRVTDSVQVSISRLRLLYPGEVIPGVGAVTGPIEMQALIVAANPAADLTSGAAASFDRNGTRKPWIERAVGQSIRLSDGLLMGAPQSAGPIEYALPLADGIDLSKSWLVFRISGPAVEMKARMADGTEMPSMGRMPDIRVFACATKNLNGKQDKAREAIQKQYYSEAC
ncbi:MAG: hypothetical protein ABI120_17295 [Gemmatimonadaceae bacterium]